MERLLRRAAALGLVLALLCSGALAESFAFTLQAEKSPDPQHEDGLAALLEVMEISGTWASSGNSFDLDADVALGVGRTRTHTGLHLYGTDSHWGLTSTLLGQEELMINVASLLPFGIKTRSYVDVPLDQAALLAPYTHTYALGAPRELLAPLFPESNGTTWLPRSEVNELAGDFLTLCDEDAAFNAWLVTTGTYETAVGIANFIIGMPPAVNGLEINRKDGCLTWDALGLLTILTVETIGDDSTLTFRIPNVAKVDGVLHTGEDVLSGSLTAAMHNLNVSLTFELPAGAPTSLPHFFINLSIQSPVFPTGSFTLLLDGTAQDDDVFLQLQKNSQEPILTIEARIIPWEPAALPDWDAQDLTGMNILSATSDSLGELIRRAQEPLFAGVYDLLVAAPPEAVQSLMDALEDLGVIDLMVDSLLGAPAY